MRTSKGKPKGRAPSTAAVTIDGADSKGKANDKEVCDDAAAVSQQRSEALRRRTAAVQEHLDKIKPVRGGEGTGIRRCSCSEGTGIRRCSCSGPCFDEGRG